MSSYDYSQMIDLVEQYYGSGSDQWLKVAGAKGYSADELLAILKQTPGVEPLVTESGQYAGWRLTSQQSYGAVSNVGSLVNSNTAGGSASVQSSGLLQIPGNFTETSGTVGAGSGTIAASTGASIATVAGTAIAATLAVGTGISLGKTIDKAIYEGGQAIGFSAEDLKYYDPDTWGDISLKLRDADLPIAETLFNVLFDVDPSKQTSQMYIDENSYAYMAYSLQKMGLLGSGIEPKPAGTYDLVPVAVPGGMFEIDTSVLTNPPLTSKQITAAKGVLGSVENVFEIKFTRTNYPSGNNSLNLDIMFGDASNTEHVTINDSVDSKPTFVRCDYPNKNNIYRRIYSVYSDGRVDSTYIGKENGQISGYQSSNILKYGNVTLSFVNIIQGLGSQQDAKLPDLSSATSASTALRLLQQQYPELWEKAIYSDVLQPDGTIKRFTYVPIPTPTSNGKYDLQPTGDGSQQSQKDTVVDPEMSDAIKNLTTTTIVAPPTTPNPPDTGDGNTPTIIPPVGKASSLWSIYNPTLEQVNQFGSWLWSSNFVEQLKKLFSDPMQAIIGLHKVYSPVQTSGVGTIKCGYLDSEVPSKLVSEQYVTVDCGSVDMQEYFGNVFDYSPYTDISIYLPFIGVRPLDPSDVVRSTISVIYHIDVLTGACLAEVNVKRDAAGGILYTFSGDAAVRYPVSSGSYMGIVSGLIGVATSVVSGNILPALGGVTRLHTSVDRSGSFTGNSGAMGSKVPYIIISRPQTAMADKFETLSGYPSNTYTQLSACRGFTQVSYCHVENMSATETEKNEIERLLKEGVIF